MFDRAVPANTEDLRLFRESVRRFVRAELEPQQARWREEHGPSPDDWRRAGDAGVLLPDIPLEFGGGGGTFAHHAVVLEELAFAGVHFGCAVQGIVARYILTYGSEAQKRTLLPRLAAGELVAAIAMTEPGAGSDVQAIRTSARRDGAHYLVKGQKTFISNGRNASLVCLAVRTGGAGMKGLSMLLVETEGLAGYRAGRPMDKIGMNAQDTCELFFDDARVPQESLLGRSEGGGFAQMMAMLPYERLSLAVAGVATMERAVASTVRYAKERRVFGKPLMELQNTRFRLAECATQARVARAFVDDCIRRHIDGTLDDAAAAMAKYWTTDAQNLVVDECLQLHGGYGYMNEFPIARMWADSRVQRIYGGTNEIMKEVIAWSL